MKKLLLMIIAAMLVFTVVGCKKAEQEPVPVDEPVVEEVQAPQPAAPAATDEQPAAPEANKDCPEGDEDCEKSQ